MTEQEAIKFLTGYLDSVVYKEKCVEAHKLAIKALEENQQYRAIGTPEECQAAVEKQKEIKNNVVDDFVERAMKQFTDFDLKHRYPTVTDCKVILRDIAEQMKGSADNEQID